MKNSHCMTILFLICFSFVFCGCPYKDSDTRLPLVPVIVEGKSDIKKSFFVSNVKYFDKQSGYYSNGTQYSTSSGPNIHLFGASFKLFDRFHFFGGIKPIATGNSGIHTGGGAFIGGQIDIIKWDGGKISFGGMFVRGKKLVGYGGQFSVEYQLFPYITPFVSIQSRKGERFYKIKQDSSPYQINEITVEETTEDILGGFHFGTFSLGNKQLAVDLLGGYSNIKTSSIKHELYISRYKHNGGTFLAFQLNFNL